MNDRNTWAMKIMTGISVFGRFEENLFEQLNIHNFNINQIFVLEICVITR